MISPIVAPHTDVAEMKVSSVGGSSYFVTFIYEASWYVSACHVNTKRELDELLK